MSSRRRAYYSSSGAKLEIILSPLPSSFFSRAVSVLYLSTLYLIVIHLETKGNEEDKVFHSYSFLLPGSLFFDSKTNSRVLLSFNFLLLHNFVLSLHLTLHSHPASSVGSVSQRADVLYLILFLLGAIFYAFPPFLEKVHYYLTKEEVEVEKRRGTERGCVPYNVFVTKEDRPKLDSETGTKFESRDF